MEDISEEIVRIREVLKKNPRGINVIDIAKEVDMNRQTVTKYLDMLIVSGNVDVKTFGPSKVYYLSQRLPVSSMISLSSDFILLLDKGLNVVNVNNSFLEFTKTNRDDIISKGIDSIPFPMEFDPPITANINDALEGKESRIDAYYKRRGKEHFYSIKFIPIAFDDGRPGATILFEDITKRKRDEDELRKLSMAVEQSPATVVITDIQGSIEYVNPKFTSLTGYTREEAIGKNPRILKSGDTPMAVYQELWDTILSGGEWRGEFHNRKKNGELYWESALIAPVKDGRGAITHLMAVKEDITEHKQAEEALRESEARRKVGEAVEVERRRLFDVLETLPAMICLLTADHRIAFANRSFRERFGEPGYRHCYETCFGRTEPCDFCETYTVFKTGTPHHWEVNAPDGSVIDAHDYPFTDVDGTPMILEMDIDITERKRIERELKKANRAYKVLAKCKEALIHEEDEVALLRKICQIVTDVGGYQLAWIGYVGDDAARTVRPVAWAGVNDGYVENLRISLNDPMRGDGPTGECLKTGKPLTVGDVRSDSRMAPWRDAALARGFLSTLNIPIVYEKRVIGNIAAYSRDAHAFNEQELELMFELAGNLAHGITALRDRARRLLAEEGLRRSHDELDARVKDRTRELEEKQEELEVQAEELEVQAEELRLTNKELEKGIQERKRAEEEIKKSEESQKALNRQLKVSNAQLTAILEVTESAMSTLDIEELLGSILARIVRVMKADASVILLKDGDRVHVRSSIGVREETRPKFSMPVGQGFAGTIAATGEPSYIGDVRTANHIIYPPFKEAGVRSVLGVPIRSHGEVIGVVHVDWMDVHPYDRRERDFLQIVADRCGMAIVNAELYERCMLGGPTKSDHR